jgi:uncharacterized repeat protein (TIGR04138 family)
LEVGNVGVTLGIMPPTDLAQHYAILQRVAENVGTYPIEAYEFVHRGLAYTVSQIHGRQTGPVRQRHISGQELCEGLRDFGLLQWGLLAEPVLRRWNVTSTLDFGRIVFILVDHKILATTEEDTIEDFRDVFDFKTGFSSQYRLACKV